MFLVGLLIGVMTAKVSQGHAMDVVYYASVNFTCHPDTTDLDPASITSMQVPGNLYRLWILPNGDVLKPDSAGNERVEVLNDGNVLHVRRVDDVDFGWYLCLVRISTPRSVTYVVDRHGINVNGAYFADLHEKYRGMAVTGLISGAVCLVVAGMICFLYNRHQARWDEDPEELKAAMEASEAAAAAAAAEAEQQFRTAAGEVVVTEKKTKEPALQKPVTQYTNAAYVRDEGEGGGGGGSGGGVKGAEGTTSQAVRAAVVVHAEEAVAKKKGRAPVPPAKQQQERELENVVAAGNAGGGGVGVGEDKAAAAAVVAAATAAAVASNVHKTKL